MKYAKIRNWNKWQSYRSDRGQPPWIKVYRALFRNLEWLTLTDAQRGQLVSIWMLAADREGWIPTCEQSIKRLCSLSDAPDLQLFVDMGFIEEWRHGDAKVTPSRRQVDASEERRGEERRVEGSPETSEQVTGPAALFDDPVFVEMPVKTGTVPIKESDIAKWEGLYGRIDVRQIVRHMVGFWDSKPRNQRKTAQGIKKSINTWLAKDDSKAPIAKGGGSGYISY